MQRACLLLSTLPCGGFCERDHVGQLRQQRRAVFVFALAAAGLERPPRALSLRIRVLLGERVITRAH
jgi:hypothetical protein